MKHSTALQVSAAILALVSSAAFASNVTPIKSAQTQVNPGFANGIAQLAQLPDLVPVISTAGAAPMFGVSNIGKAASTQSVLYIHCQKQNPAGPCPMNNSNDPMVESSNAMVTVPAVKVGETKWFNLSDIPGATPANGWAQGAYVFSMTVDSTNQVKESNESNNSTQGPHVWNK